MRPHIEKVHLWNNVIFSNANKVLLLNLYFVIETIDIFLWRDIEKIAFFT